jgi:dolichol-phosphate mannosyltransferase
MNHSEASRKTISILLPVRNEGVNLKIMLRILRAVLELPHEVLVVCDTPDDTSIPVVVAMQREYPNCRLIHNTIGRGVTNAIRAGVDEATGETILIFAADEVGPVLAIEDMFALIESGCDFVSCTRYAHGGRRLGGSLIGHVLSRIANRLFHLLSGCALTDATTGIKMMKREAYYKLDLEARPVGWAVAFEMSIKAQLIGLKLGEVPIISIDRLYGGQSTFKLVSWTAEYLRWFLWGAKRLRGRSSANKTVAVRKSACAPLAANVRTK